MSASRMAIVSMSINPFLCPVGAVQPKNGERDAQVVVVSHPPPCLSPGYSTTIVILTHESGTVNSSGGSAIVNLKTTNGTSTYCCGTVVASGGDTICRDDTDSFQLADAQVLTGRAALANLVPPDSASNSSSNSSITAPASSNSHDTTIGVGLGVPLGVIAIGSLLWALWERRRANKLSRAMMSSSVPAQEGLVRSPQSHVMSESSVPTELDSHRQIPELMPREQM